MQTRLDIILETVSDIIEQTRAGIRREKRERKAEFIKGHMVTMGKHGIPAKLDTLDLRDLAMVEKGSDSRKLLAAKLRGLMQGGPSDKAFARKVQSTF